MYESSENVNEMPTEFKMGSWLVSWFMTWAWLGAQGPRGSDPWVLGVRLAMPWPWPAQAMARPWSPAMTHEEPLTFD